jgi:hypothetical protein
LPLPMPVMRAPVKRICCPRATLVVARQRSCDRTRANSLLPPAGKIGGKP